jgi:O-methyltransferase domain/Dimerisation domain
MVSVASSALLSRAEGNLTHMHPTSPRRVLAQLLVGNQIQQAIYVATKLGIAEQVRNGPKTIEEMSAAAGAHSGALRRLLHALAGFGIFAEDEAGRFELTPMASLLQEGVPDSMSAFALWSGGISYRAFGGLEYSVRTGEPAFENLFGTDFFNYLAENLEAGALFDDLMAWSTEPVAVAVAEYDFTGMRTVVDLGGGRGDLLAAVLRAQPGLRGLLVDRLNVIERAQRLLEANGLATRCATLAADILQTVPPGGDLYILKSVVHGLDDRTATRLLSNCRAALGGLGKVLLVEFMMPPGNDPFPGKLMDLLMLVGCHGRERTAVEFRDLFAGAGFRIGDVVTTKYGYSLIEGIAA